MSLIPRRSSPCSMCRWLDRFGSLPRGSWGAFKHCPAEPKCKPDQKETEEKIT